MNKDIALKEAAEIIKILTQNRSKSLDKHIYTDERVARWWRHYGVGDIKLIAKKGSDDE